MNQILAKRRTKTKIAPQKPRGMVAAYERAVSGFGYTVAFATIIIPCNCSEQPMACGNRIIMYLARNAGVPEKEIKGAIDCALRHVRAEMWGRSKARIQAAKNKR